MAEDFLNASLPDLKELENKVGRKTPESLLIWMKDAADCEETWRCDIDNNNLRSDNISEKICNLKQEMRWLRSTDVRILRQLLAVHEGIEALRWLVEDRGASVSQSSSLTGSLSSLITVEEPGLSLSHCRDSLTSPQDMTEDTAEDLTHQPLHTASNVLDHKNYLSPQYAQDRHPSIFSAHRFEVSQPPRSRLESRPQHPDRGDLDLVRGALLRSSRISRQEQKPSISLHQDDNLGESQTELELQERFQDFKNKRTHEDKIVQEEEKVLLGYDAQWCWVESPDDVTFL